MKTIFEYLAITAKKAASIQHGCGCMPAGHNGPYRDPETPVRSTAHWLVVFCSLYEITKDIKLRKAAEKATDYLLSDAARPMGASFYCRKKPWKDCCNGLIGQAWVIEALMKASRTLQRTEAKEVALALHKLHPFDEQKAIWHRVSVDGSYLTCDGTYNHQLWFATVGSLLGDAETNKKILSFFDHVATKVSIYSSGVVFHQSELSRYRIADCFTPRKCFGAIAETLKKYKNWNRLYDKSVGYHSFNLYAFALLKQHIPNHSFWSSLKFKKMLNITRQASYHLELENNQFGWPYNPPGIELAFVGERFGLGRDYCQKWILEQCRKTYDPHRQDLMTKGSPDVITSSARIYEATNLIHNYEIVLNG